MKSTAVAVAIAIATMVATATHAEESVTLETITVKGTKEEKDDFDNPESVLILREHEIPTTGRSNNLQVLNAVPNVEVNKNGESFTIRGINSTGVTTYQKDSLASLLIDDLFQTDLAIQAGSFNLWDMERIEILRGAQSTNQGVNSLAGSILLDHRRPSFTNEGAAKLGLGSFWHRELGVVANSVLSEDKTAVRASYDKEMNDGYITNIANGNDKWGQWNRDRVTLGIQHKISEKDVLNFNGKFHRNDQGGTYVQGTDAFRYEVNEDQDYQLKTTNHQFTAGYSRAFSEQLNGTAVFGFSRSGQDSLTDADGTAQNTAGARRENHDDHYFSFEGRLHDKSEKINHLLGFHTHDFGLKDGYDFNLLFPLSAAASTPVAVQQSMDRSRRVYAVFDSFTYQFDHHHSVIAGARGEYVEAKYGTGISGARLEDVGSKNAAVDAYISGIAGTYEGRNSSFVVLPKAGYVFTSGPHHTGFTYARAYRTAGVSINRRRATIVEYGPEFTNNYEASYKYSGETFQFSSNFFYIDWRNQQVQVQLSNDFYDTQVQNAAKSEVYGTELEGKLRLGPRHSLAAGVGYANTRFKEFQTRSGDYAGNSFPFAAHWTGRISYELKPMEGLGLLTLLRYVDDSYVNAENTRKADAQFYIDLNAKYALRDAWVIEGYVNNLLDGKYHIFDGTPVSDSTSPYQASYHQVNTPREFGARVTRYW